MIKFVKVMVVVNVLIVVHMITGCEDNEIQVKSLQVVERDGCEYLVNELVCPNGYGTIFSHKGNCKNPIHNSARKEEDEQNEVKKNREDRRK